MLNQARQFDIQTMLARQLGHLLRAGESPASAFEKLHDAADGEFKGEVERLRRHLETSDDTAAPMGSRFATPIATLARLADVARREGGRPETVFARAEEVLGPLAEAYRAYWAGIGALLWYAFMIIGLMFLVLIVFSIFVFPVLAEVFEGSEQAMPALTVFLMTTLQPLIGLAFFVIAGAVVGMGIGAYKMREAMKRLEPLRGVMTRMPGLSVLCDAYNTAMLLNFSRLLAHAGVSAETALDAVTATQQTRRAGNASETDVALALARRTGTLEDELEHLSLRAHDMFAYQLAKVREEFTLVAQVIAGLVVGGLVLGMYLPIFNMGSIV